MINLQKIKDELMQTYQAELCEESVIDIRNAQNAKELVSLLHKYAIFINYQAFPVEHLLRKWFEGEKDMLNSNGIYLDQITTISDPEQQSIFCAGKCDILFIVQEPHIYKITLQDESNLSIIAHRTAVVKVRNKGKGTITTHYKAPNATIKQFVK